MQIGVDYYPEHWDETRWPIDARLMREAGISVVRLVEFAWSRLEPSEGCYDFSWLDRVLDIIGHEGMQAILGIPTAAPPAWLHEKYPDLYPADARRFRLGFGTRLQRCLNNPTMRSYAERITGAMAGHFAGHPAVAGWQIDNEFEANLCYCDICADSFRRWLRDKYGSLEHLNKSWGTVFWSQEYSDWTQIPLPWQARCGRSHNPSMLLDYQRFASWSAVEFQRLLAATIRQKTTGHFITHNFMGLHDSLDYYQLARELDFVSWDNYPLFSRSDNPAEVALAHDLARGFKEKGFWVMEEQCGITGWERMGRRPAPGRIRAWAWQAVAHGAEAVVFFRWRSSLSGTEQFWQGILDHDGMPRRRYGEIARFGRELKELSALLDGSTVQNQVAILNSYEQNWAFQIQPQTEGLGWWEQNRRFYDSLTRLGVNADFVPSDANLSRYRLVIAPGWFILTARDARRLTDYVRQGGTLILNPRTGVKNEFNICHELPLPSLLREMAGLEVEDYDPLGPDQSRVRLPDGREYAVSVWADSLRLEDAEALAVYTEPPFAGKPVAARRRFGDGVVYYLGSFGEPAFYDDVLGGIIEKTGIERLVGLPGGIDACWRERDGERYLFLVNFAGHEMRADIPGGMKALLDGSCQDGVATLPSHGVGIFKK